MINKESEQEVSFNPFSIAIYEKKFINGCGGVEPPGKVQQPYIQYEMAPKLKRLVFDPSSQNCDRFA